MDNTINYIKIEDIIPSKLQPHQNNDDGLEGLTISIQNYGIIQPLLLRKNNEKYEIVLGNRRYKAAVNIGLKQVPAIVLKLNDKQAAEYIILDNIQRKELRPQEKEKIYQDIYAKFNIDKSYINSNLGIPINNSQSQSNLLNKEKRFESDINNQRFTLPQTNNNSRDIVNLKDLNHQELEREDFIMNNEPMNSNIVNTNVNTMPGVTPTNNSAPTFGGRFFPSLEDEQTNMELNSGIPSPEQPTAFTTNSTSSPLIDLTDLSGESPTSNSRQSNPQLEPIPNFGNPTIDNLNQSSLTGVTATEHLSQPAPFELPKQQSQFEMPPIGNPIAPQPEMPNISELNQGSSSQFEMPSIGNLTSPQPEMPNISALSQTASPQFEVPPMNNPAMDKPEVPNIPNLEPQPTSIPTPSAPESKDITPAINTIKSLADTISSLGYKLNITETDLGSSYNITIDIQK